jgi:hypothetical protein
MFGLSKPKHADAEAQFERDLATILKTARLSKVNERHLADVMLQHAKSIERSIQRDRDMRNRVEGNATVMSR